MVLLKMIKKFKQYNESTEFNLDIDITDLNQEFIDKLIDKLSFVYKKLKDRHVRPINIKGKTSTDNIDLKIILSNKDKIDFSFKKENEIKISINGNLLFHMDDFNKDNILNKLYKIYTDYLKEGKYKITKKDNPFESLDLSILENFSNTNPNPGILNRDGRNFWYGVYDIETGYIQDVYEYNETAYMNNDYYISDECLDLINSYQSDIFWINSSGDIESEWNLYLDEEDEETEKIQFLISKIKEQISFVGSFKEIYNRNKKLVYENKNNKNYEKRYNN